MTKPVLTKGDFAKALTSENLGFSIQHIDTLFDILDQNKDGLLEKINFDQLDNFDPRGTMSMLREIILGYGLTADDLLHKMRLRIWDDGLDFTKFSEALHRIDPSLNEYQLKNMAKILKNRDNVVEIPTLVRNLVGKDFETVDYRNKIFRQIYNEVNNKGLEAKLKEYF